jgi:hypothetical protein
MVRPISTYNPEARSPPVRHDVERTADVDDMAAVRRDLWVGGPLELEHVAYLEAIAI